MKIIITIGFREDQKFSVDIEEAHKAYYLFTHPEQRGIFNDGTAVIGADIRKIEPDLQGSMEWNPTHRLDSDDWNEIHKLGVDRKIRDKLYKAKMVAALMKPEMLNLPLSQIELPTLAPPTEHPILPP